MREKTSALDEAYRAGAMTALNEYLKTAAGTVSVQNLAKKFDTAGKARPEVLKLKQTLSTTPPAKPAIATAKPNPSTYAPGKPRAGTAVASGT